MYFWWGFHNSELLLSELSLENYLYCITTWLKRMQEGISILWKFVNFTIPNCF